MEDMRMHKRINCHEQVIINDRLQAPCLSLSEGGMFLGTGYYFPQDSHVKLKFRVNGIPIISTAQIRHTQKDMGVGIKFTGLDDAARSSIRRYIEKVMAMDSGATIKRRLLLIDPDPIKRKMYKSRLVSDGYTVYEAADGMEGLGLLMEEHMDLVVMDLYLDELNGLNVISCIRKNRAWSGLPIVVLASQAVNQDFDRAVKLGADEILLKMTTTPAMLSSVAAKRITAGHTA